MSSPFFSVIIPTYNRTTVLGRAVSSVINQTFTDWELIIIDDGSNDNTNELVEKFNDTRISYFYQTNQERSAARNNGIMKAKGKYVCFLDSDDEYYLDYLELLYTEVSTNGFPIAFIKSIPFIQYENQTVQSFDEDFESDNNSMEHFLTTYSPLCAICCHHLILKENLFDVTLKYAEDTNLWMRILSKHKLYNFKIRSCIVHISASINISQEKIHWAYINSFKKTFSIPAVKSNVANNIFKNLIKKRLEWIRAEKIGKKDVLGYIFITIKLQLLKIGVI